MPYSRIGNRSFTVICRDINYIRMKGINRQYDTFERRNKLRVKLRHSSAQGQASAGEMNPGFALLMVVEPAPYKLSARCVNGRDLVTFKVS